MDRLSASRRHLIHQYLIGYNLSCAVLWVAVFGRVILLLLLVGTQHVYGGVGDFAKWTQTIALLEVLHSALGMKSCLALFSHSCFQSHLLTSCYGRPCPLSYPHDSDAGLVAYSSGLAHCERPPPSHCAFTCI